MGFFRWLNRLFGPAIINHENHRVNPATFLEKLKEGRPNRLTIERMVDLNERLQYRFSFTTELFEGGTWRCKHYVIMFDTEFVPPVFRRFTDEAAWDDDGSNKESIWFDRRGTVKNPHKKLAR